MLLADMRANLVKGDAELESKLSLDDWVYKPGLPANVARPVPSAFAEVDAAATEYIRTRTIDAKTWEGWTTAERLRLLAKLPGTLNTAQLTKLDDELALSKSGNAEVLFAWLKLALANRYEKAVPVAEQFLDSVG